MKKVTKVTRGSLSGNLGLLAFLLILIIAIISCSTSKKVTKSTLKGKEPEVIFVVVEEMPQFPGGDEGLMKFIQNNIKYPEQAKANNITGRVLSKFTVNSDGTIGKIQVLKPVDPLLDAEAIRVIRSMPVWKPGKQGGKPVNVWYVIPIEFSLSGGGKDIIRMP